MDERREDYPLIVKDIEDIKQDCRDIKYILNGNGTPGLVAKVASHGEKIAELESINKERSKEGRDMGTFIFRAIITLVLGFIAVKVGLK